jgi:hypothetical protein
VGAAFPHIFDQQVFRKALILDIGVCIWRKMRKKETAQIPGYLISQYGKTANVQIRLS